MATENPPIEIDAARIIDGIKSALGIEAVTLQHTGGGVATIYVGEPTEDAYGDPLYPVIIGPGSFDWSDGRGRATFGLVDDIFVGPDGDVSPDECDTPATYAELLVAVRKHYDAAVQS